MDMFLDDQRKLYCSTMDILSSEMSIIDDIVALFGELSILATNLATARVISLFILSVSQDFAPACSLVLGGRLDAAYAVARRSLEILGISRMIAHDPEASPTWAAAHKDDQSWKAFKRKFTIENMFPKGDLFWDKIFRLYDHLAREHHPNPKSFSRIKEHSRTDTQIQFAISSLSFGTEEFRENATAFWVIVYIFSMVLLGFAGILLVHCEDEECKKASKAATSAGEFVKKAWDKMRPRGKEG